MGTEYFIPYIGKYLSEMKFTIYENKIQEKSQEFRKSGEI